MNVEFSLDGVFDEAVRREAEATDHRDKTALPGSVARERNEIESNLEKIYQRLLEVGYLVDVIAVTPEDAKRHKTTPCRKERSCISEKRLLPDRSQADGSSSGARGVGRLAFTF